MNSRNLLLIPALVWAVCATSFAIYQYRQNPTILSRGGSGSVTITYVGGKKCQTFKGERGQSGAGDGGDALICDDDFAIAAGASGPNPRQQEDSH